MRKKPLSECVQKKQVLLCPLRFYTENEADNPEEDDGQLCLNCSVDEASFTSFARSFCSDTTKYKTRESLPVVLVEDTPQGKSFRHCVICGAEID